MIDDEENQIVEPFCNNSCKEEKQQSTAARADKKKDPNGSKVVFTSRVKYGVFFWSCIAFVLVTSLLRCLFLAAKIDNYEERMEMIWSLFWSFSSILIVFVFVIPVEYQIRSDASIDVSTVFKTYNFTDSCRAYKASGPFDSLSRAKIKFAMDLHSRVIVVRKHGRWDLLLSPVDMDGFIQVVNNVSA